MLATIRQIATRFNAESFLPKYLSIFIEQGTQKGRNKMLKSVSFSFCIATVCLLLLASTKTTSAHHDITPFPTPTITPMLTPTPTPSCEIIGLVTDVDTAAPISGATVSVDTGQTTTTAANGGYILNNVPVGDRTYTASATGYASSSQTVTITEGVQQE